MTERSHVSELLPAVVNGSASDAERAAVNAHLPSCPACAAELEGWRRVALAVRDDAPPAPDTATVLDGVWRRLDADQAGSASAPPRARSSWSRVWRPVWSTAAVFALVLGLVVVESGRETPQEVLLAAAVLTSAQDTAALRVSGTARFDVQTPRSTPSPGTPMSLSADINGEGAVRFGEALHVRLDLDLDASALGVDGRSGVLERLVLGERRYERRDGGGWQPRDDTTGTVGVALLDPRLPERVLTNADGAVHADPAVERLHGVPVRRYAFDLTDDAFPPAPGAAMRYRAEVWIGEADGLLHALRMRAAGPVSAPVAGRWDIDLRMELVDFGEPVTMPSPAGAGADPS